MSDLFLDLRRYRPRFNEGEKADRDPLEDWLTECLATCLRALAKQSKSDLVPLLSHLSGLKENQIVRKILSADLLFLTQQVCDDKTRPDLVIYVNRKPWIVVENKVSHKATLSQLICYAEWLKAQVDDYAGAIAFITHHTRAPDGFHSQHQSFKGLGTRVTSWGAVSKILLKATENHPSNTISKELAISFNSQLEDLNLSSNYPSSKSLSAADVFMNLGAGIEVLSNDLLKEAACIGDFSKQPTQDARPYFHTGLYYAVRWAKNVRGDQGAYVATGFWFPGSGTYGADWEEHLGEAISDTVKIFVTIESEDLMEMVQDAPPLWRRNESEFLAFVSGKNPPHGGGSAAAGLAM